MHGGWGSSFIGEDDEMQVDVEVKPEVDATGNYMYHHMGSAGQYAHSWQHVPPPFSTDQPISNNACFPSGDFAHSFYSGGQSLSTPTGYGYSSPPPQQANNYASHSVSNSPSGPVNRFPHHGPALAYCPNGEPEFSDCMSIDHDESTEAQYSTRETSVLSDSTKDELNWWESADNLLQPFRLPVSRDGERGQVEGSRTCHRCRIQRIKCFRDPNNPDPNAECQSCSKVRHGNSKKTEHWIPCLNNLRKLNAMTFYRSGNLGLTRRFDHTQMNDISAINPGEFFEIQIIQRLCPKPMVLQVHYFKPAEGDKLDREFVAKGIRQVQKLPPICLRDVKKTSKEFARYIEENALEAIAIASERCDSNEIINQIFAMIPRHLESLPPGEKESEFLKTVVRYWFAITLGLGSSHICGGETFNITPVSGYEPRDGLVSVPRMVVAQFDSIRHLTVYTKLQRDVLYPFEDALSSKVTEQWFTMFLVTFLLLNIVSTCSWDRFRYVRENSQGLPLDTRYGKLGDPNTALIEQLHYSAAVLLAHWDYYKRCDLTVVNGKALYFLEPYQLDFIRSISAQLKQRSIPKTPLDGFWEHDVAWTSLMFSRATTKENQWTPPPIFGQERPSVGRIDDWPY
ncbi:hypothetical protein QBC43DRAFT_73377 [Cladorrhinum sp. PSN259]|nr:hypothetical protein QBC43DRAFT_73377 [Cladorrhinum sp. PSN259]